MPDDGYPAPRAPTGIPVATRLMDVALVALVDGCSWMLIWLIDVCVYKKKIYIYVLVFFLGGWPVVLFFLVD